MATKALFNEGKFTSTTIDEQYNDAFWSKMSVKEAAKKKYFTQMGDRFMQPKHFGDEIEKERELPIAHPLNRLDSGVDAATADLVKQVYYATNASGTLVSTHEARDYDPATTDCYDAAVAAAGAGGKVENGAGSLYNGDADYAVVTGTFPSLGEEGGNVNEVNSKSITVKGNVAEFGYHTKFTQRSLDMDTRPRLLARKTKQLADQKGDTFEQQIQADLVSAGEANKVFCGTTATSFKTCDQGAELTYADLRNMEQQLKKDRVPRDTKIITGSTKVDTKTISKAYYVFVGQELYPTLQDMENAKGDLVWDPIEKYKDAAGSNTADGEIGRIGSFRFIEVENMLQYMGKGAADTGSGATDVTGWNAAKIPFGDTDAGSIGFDVFPLLFVGSDSFGTVGFEGDSSKIKTVMPRADANIDQFGKNGSLSIAWYYGSLIYRPERIKLLLATAKIA